MWKYSEKLVQIALVHAVDEATVVIDHRPFRS